MSEKTSSPQPGRQASREGARGPAPAETPAPGDPPGPAGAPPQAGRSPEGGSHAPKTGRAASGALRAIAHAFPRSNALVFLLAIFVSLLVGAVLMAIAGVSVVDGYSAMIRGAFYDWKASNPTRQILPLTMSVFSAVPLVIAGLGLAFGFRAGLFNIGGKGQVVMGGIAAAWVGFSYDLPAPVHLLACLAASVAAGGLYGFIAGYLKAATGANEVIVTIMLNSIAAHLLSQVLSLKAFNGEGETGNRKSLAVADSAQYPSLAGSPFRLHAGFLLALLVAVAVWWLMERSRLGFQLRATGLNADAARTAGMSVPWVTSLVMMISGALCGLAATAPVLGTQKSMDESVVGSIGFDAITVALLGRSRPVGTVLAGLLFGALRAGGTAMQAAPGTHIKIVLVLQSTIVLFIAAPPLVRAVFRLPERREFRGGDPSSASVPAAAPATAPAPAAPAAKEA